ncbi:MAG: pilus assembly PilX N-terminal domain-containing protein [Candidatus Roizmanbacteria bacterium]|nr:pilus assembly PilX N-terminal domain-containing protein [Candidatus Roizmanbacteria bacterium]
MKTHNRKGQVLLIAVMLLATVITVVMTIAFNATTETQVARLEVDSQKALAAAEAGIDAVIKQSINTSTPVDIGLLGQFNEQKISGSAKMVGNATPYFVTPLVQKDGQYTLYLSDYPGYANPWNGSFNIYLVSESGQCPSIEVTIIKKDYSQDRYVYNNSCLIPEIIKNASTLTTQVSTTIDGVVFQYKTSNPITVTNGVVAFVKVLGGITKLGFQSTDVAVSLPLQGRKAQSEARTESGVVKRVELFQSFPQFPANFFTTSF